MRSVFQRSKLADVWLPDKTLGQPGDLWELDRVEARDDAVVIELSGMCRLVVVPAATAQHAGKVLEIPIRSLDVESLVSKRPSEHYDAGALKILEQGRAADAHRQVTLLDVD